MENNFNTLLKATQEHIPNKKYLYKPAKRKNGKEVKYKGVTQYENATPHKTILLSLAFNMALENYENIRPSKGVKELERLEDISDMLLRYFGNKYYKSIDNIKGENSLIDSEQNYEIGEIKNFKAIEYKLYGVIKRFRNYHSHYIHEPGVLTFSDLFKTDNTLSQDEFDEAKNWFEKRFNDTQAHLKRSLQDRKDKLKEEDATLYKTKIKEIDKVLSFFKYTTFFNEDEKTISLDGQLFMACMFLYKRQAKIVLDKWRNVKEPVGYGNTKHTFYTYFCLSEKYSINNYNDNLLKFRDITSKLSTIPYHKNENLEFLYSKIREINEEAYTKAESLELKISSSKNTAAPRRLNNNCVKKLEVKIEERNTLKDLLETSNKRRFREAFEKVSQEIADLKTKNATAETIGKTRAEIQLEDTKRKIMPIRKRYVLTKVLLQYILDNNLIPAGNNNAEIKIAIKKTTTDVLEYYATHKEVLDSEKNLTFLKDRIKTLKKGSDERRELNEHFKELKRNFIFKTPDELKKLATPLAIYDEENKCRQEAKGYSFTLKKENVLIQYTDVNKTKTINITLSPQLLLKWVFIHLTTKNNRGFEIIEAFINKKINLLSKKGISSEAIVSAFSSDGRYKHIKKGNVLRRSIVKNTNTTNTVTTQAVVKHINNKVVALEKLYRTNSLHPKPWTYDAKGKIDIILQYQHFCLLHDVYINNIHEKHEDFAKNDAEHFIRHNYYNMSTFNIAREYFRYFGRYESNSMCKTSVSIAAVNSLKKDYSLCFKYIDQYIKHSNSLEALFNNVIVAYIEQLNSIAKNLKTKESTVSKLIKVLKINTISNTDHVNKLVKEGFYLKSFAVGPDVISIQSECKSLWDDFAEKKQKTLNGKPFVCSDFTFIRYHLENLDNVKTNIDYLLTHIMPKTGEKRIAARAFNQLLKIKTEELMLWNIAKHYWQEASGNTYAFTDTEKDSNNSNYQLYCTFNKVYNRVLDYKIKIGPSFWFKKNGDPNGNQERFKTIIEHNKKILEKELSFTVHVPARKYDNKLLGVETKLIQEFCLWNLLSPKGTIELPKEYKYKKKNNVEEIYNLNNYEPLMKVIYKELKKSVDDIAMLLKSEKKMVEANQEAFFKVVTNKYKDAPEIEDFYLSLTKQENKADFELFKSFLAKAKSYYTTSNESNNKMIDIKNYLVFYRNFALHYQLQDTKRRDTVFRFFKDYNAKNKDTDKHYTHNE